jgi:hypothetical protein
MLEKMMKKKDTLVYIYAPWCGACREFDANVMNHVQSLKNKSMNIAKIDSKLASKTGLPAAQYLPTLMLVENGKPKTFKDENGQPTTVMPRANSLSEDRETLTNLVQHSGNTVSGTSHNSLHSVPERNTVANRNTRKNTLTSSPEKLSLPSYNKEGSPARSSVTLKSLAKSPYDGYINGMPTPSAEKEKSEDTLFTPIKSSIKASIPVSSPPDIGADLVASQDRKTVTSKSGGMLEAIRQKTNSLNALTKLRNTRKH